MSESIISNKKECLVCGYQRNLDRHHVFGGRTGNRNLSEKDGCWVYLCKVHHTMSNESVHLDNKMNLKLKMECQKRWEEIYGTREDFIKRYGKSYL